ncbi:hypothetical protein TEPIDINF_002052 [Tepidibacillus infernus]|uniref:Uncharacterized protein n=1 Tax=Tepidibacillus decaturensis TaxID=1413211 RepID=A0A135L673_9BACI|nr:MULTISPECIES: hypothetical protein [Tepidibacillus]KXG44491.1 hypothetical protein U473_11055 [Tepidibacillus decaturensis]GBF10517.1 hypothetical protein HK1_00529 [Tepidibacillus sp. HK-1]
MLFLFLATLLMVSVMIIEFNRNKNKNSVDHYFIVVKNNQMTIEWVIRSISLSGWLKGRIRRFTILDLGSTDDTLIILYHLSLSTKIEIVDLQPEEDVALCLLEMVTKSKETGENPVVIDLTTSSTCDKASEKSLLS